MSGSPIIFSARWGLSNRVRALVGAQAVASLTQSPLLIHWKLHGSCPAKFDELYDLSALDSTRLINKREADELISSAPQRSFDTAEWFTHIPIDAFNITVSHDEYCARAVDHLRKLKPIDRLNEAIDHLAISLNLGECVGVHIRMTDNVEAYAKWQELDPNFEPGKISQLEGFCRLLKALSRNHERVFLATDNNSIGTVIGQEFSNVLMYDKRYCRNSFLGFLDARSGSNVTSKLMLKVRRKLGIFNWRATSWRTTSVEDALIDLMLLSRCRKIVGTYYSSFGEVSALIGDIPLEILEGQETRPDTFIASLRQKHANSALL